MVASHLVGIAESLSGLYDLVLYTKAGFLSPSDSTHYDGWVEHRKRSRRTLKSPCPTTGRADPLTSARPRWTFISYLYNPPTPG
jgi:hypothetical protein